MKIGVIGTGMMGKNHIRVYNELKSVNDVYIYDVNQQSMNDIEDYYKTIDSNVYACKTLNSLIDAVDAISVCVPTQFHKSTVEKILSIDDEKPLLIEKPICSTSKDGIDLWTKIPKNLICGVGHVERFNPIVPEIKKILRYESPLYMEFKRHNPSSSRMTNTDVIEDLMIHDIDIMSSLLHDVVCSTHGAGNNDVFDATLTANNVLIHFSASRKSSKKIRSIYIELEEFTIDADYMSQEITIYSKPDRYKYDNERYTQENIVEKVMVNKKEPLKEELKTFIDCVKHNNPFPVSIENAINSMLICDDLKKYIFDARSLLHK
jgi:predicted dehydrogenase